jgi:hypothetical protein
VAEDLRERVVKADVLKFKGRPCLTPAQWLDRAIEPPDRLLGDLFSTTARILFAADTGLGKTMLAMAWAFSIALGKDFLHWKARRKARVLYIDGEMPRDLLQERIGLACKWFEIGAAEARNLSLLSREDFEDMPPLDSEEGQKWLDGFIDGHGPFDFIIFDNIMSLCSVNMKEEDSWQAIKPYALSLTRRKIGQMWIHHTGHNVSRSYGTKTREWQMDTVMIGDRVESDHHLGFNLRFTKTRRRKPSNFDDFKNVFIELDEDTWSYGEPVSTEGGRPNKSNDIALAALREVINEDESDVFESVWRERAYELGISESNKEESRRKAFQRAQRALIKSGTVIVKNKRYSIAE